MDLARIDRERRERIRREKRRRREGFGARTLAVALLGFALGFLAGVLISELVGIAGYVLYGQPGGGRFLPVILGATCAALAPVLDARIRKSPPPAR